MAATSTESCHKEQSCEGKENASNGTNNASNLATFMWNKDNFTLVDVQEYFKSGVVDVDERNEHGQTGLMLACQLADKDIVKFLVEKGANPNLTCSQRGNTALHYACEYTIYDDDGEVKDWETMEEITQSENASVESTTFLQEKKPIDVIDFLDSECECNAILVKNNDGLNCVELAALNRKLHTVAYCVSKEWLTLPDQIRVMEILGMFEVLDGDKKNAYKCLFKAIKLRNKNPNNPLTKDHESLLESCLGKAECKNLEELKTITTDKHAFKAEAFLIGDRVLPPQLKSEHVYGRLAQYGYDLLSRRKTMEKAFTVFSGCLQLEQKDLMPVGRVLMFIMFSIRRAATTNHALYKVIPQFLYPIYKVLNDYVEVVQQVNQSSLATQLESIVDDLACILFDVTAEFSSLKVTGEVLEPTIAMVTIMRSRVPKPPDLKLHDTFSVSHHILCTLVAQLCNNDFFVETEYKCNRFKWLLARLIQVEGVHDITTSGNSMLHNLMRLVSSGEFQLVCDLTKLILRHGCRPDTKNNDGQTPMDIAKEQVGHLDSDDDYEGSQIRELFNLLKGPVMVHSLQELAARTIFCHRIPYEGILPDRVQDVLKDDILKEDESGFQTPSDCGSDSSYDPPWLN